MCFEGFDHIIPPLLENTDFYLWKARMKSFVLSSSFKMWDVFEKDSDFKPKVNWTEEEKNLFYLNIRAMQILYKSLTDSDFQKIKHCSNARDIWNTLDAMYASDHSLGSKAVQSSFCAPCGSTGGELQEADIEQAIGSEESVDLCLDSEAEENEVSELEPSELQNAYNELHIEFYKLAKEVLGLRKKNKKLEEFIASSTSKVSKVPSMEEQLSLPIASSLPGAEAPTCSEHCSNCESLSREQEKFSKGPETPKVYLKEQRVFENKIDQQDNDRKSHSEYHSIICHYCGRSGHISHTCSLRKIYM